MNSDLSAELGGGVNLKTARSPIRWSSLKFTAESSRSSNDKDTFEVWDAHAKLISCVFSKQKHSGFYSKAFFRGRISFCHDYVTYFKALRPYLNLNCHATLQRLCFIPVTSEKWITKWSLLPLSTPGGNIWAPWRIKTGLAWKHKHTQGHRRTRLQYYIITSHSNSCTHQIKQTTVPLCIARIHSYWGNPWVAEDARARHKLYRLAPNRMSKYRPQTFNLSQGRWEEAVRSFGRFQTY